MIKEGFENMNIDYIHKCLSQNSYWSKGIPFETVKKAWENSFCVGYFDENDNQTAFARIITDYSTFAYLCDVFVDETLRGKGYGKELMEHIMNKCWIKNLRRFMLATLDAHKLYEQFGFKLIKNPERFMEISKPNIYGDCLNKCN